jgi:hypothetical protein
MILFISPPCSNLLVHIDHGLAQLVPRGAVGRLAYHEVRGAIRYFVFPLLSSRGVSAACRWSGSYDDTAADEVLR